MHSSSSHCQVSLTHERSVVEYLESDGQGLVAAPVCWQDGAEEVWAVSAHQFSWVVREHLHHVPVSHAQFPHQGGATALLSAQRQTLVHLPRAQGRRGRREASPRRRFWNTRAHYAFHENNKNIFKHLQYFTFAIIVNVRCFFVLHLGRVIICRKISY